jgi:hypothetical protein
MIAENQNYSRPRNGRKSEKEAARDIIKEIQGTAVNRGGQGGAFE